MGKPYRDWFSDLLGLVDLAIWNRASSDKRAEGEVMRYLIIIERTSDGGYGAWAPDLPGCVALSGTPEECEREMREAVALHLEGLRIEGEPIPAPSAMASVVDVPAA
jgi:predicted RNase H-like HicB family nuclease